MNVKQVLIWNKGVRNAKGQKVRTGKIAAQLAHASLKAIFDLGHEVANDNGPNDYFCIPMTFEVESWLTGKFTKICVGVNSEEELLDIYKQAQNVGIPCALIQDAGLTEFNNIPTYTAVAIGPAEAQKIDEITGNLKLL